MPKSERNQLFASQIFSWEAIAGIGGTKTVLEQSRADALQRSASVEEPAGKTEPIRMIRTELFLRNTQYEIRSTLDDFEAFGVEFF